jgi:hypothetical protein
MSSNPRWQKPVWLLEFEPQEQQLIALARSHYLNPPDEKAGHFSTKAYHVIGKLVSMLEEATCPQEDSPQTPSIATLRRESG